MELAPDEAVKTNVLGTLQVIEACERHGVERFVLISTDKAVAPVNMMGLTKSLAERVMLDAARRGKLSAVAVRFGNVLASRGSVVPIFEEQLRHGGPLTVTDPRGHALLHDDPRGRAARAAGAGDRATRRHLRARDGRAGARSSTSPAR